MPLNVGYLTAKTDKASDEVYTPAYAIKPLLKYLKPNSIIWCPFDMDYSEYVKIFKQTGYTVINSHIDTGENFFTFVPEQEYDVIISNPPFSIKDQVLQRLDEIGKPYAMLLPIPTLQGQKRFEYMKNCQALIFDKRINYYTNRDMTQVQKGVSFGSFYLCKDFLPEKLIFEKLDTEDE